LKGSTTRRFFTSWRDRFGLESAPAALRRLFTGANVGKQLIQVAD